MHHYGHLARLAVWRLRETWDADAAWGEKLEHAGAAMAELASWEEVRERLQAEGPLASRSADTVAEEREEYGVRALEIPF